MSKSDKGIVTSVLLLAMVIWGCKAAKEKSSAPSTNSNKSSNANVTASAAKPDKEGIIHSGTGEEKEKPAAGKANVDGKDHDNGKTDAGIEVKLCEKFN